MAALVVSAVALVGVLETRAPRWARVKPAALVSAAGDDSAAPAPASISGGGSSRPPSAFAEALADALLRIDSLRAEADSVGLVPHYGRRANSIVQSALEVSGVQPASRDEKALKVVLDGPLRALFQQQLQTLWDRAVDKYDEIMASKPNPYEAGEAARQLFLTEAEKMLLPDSNWSFEAELNDLMTLLSRSHGHDAKLVELRGKQGQGKQVTIEVIRKLQSQAASIRREAEVRGAFPWNVKWQYFVERSPVGFRGQYSQGRSIVELLLMPDPRSKKSMLNKMLNKVGPLNLAVGFDLFL